MSGYFIFWIQLIITFQSIILFQTLHNTVMDTVALINNLKKFVVFTSYFLNQSVLQEIVALCVNLAINFILA